MNSKLHQYVFEVASDATKDMVKNAVETIFDVKVMRVNVINMPAKHKKNLRSRRTTNRRSSFKKAVITLAPGDTIPVFEGVK
jgi:large subunit ribosomal protein L23